MSTNLQRLKAHILPLSRSPIWSEAVEEWSLVSVYMDDKHCPCGQDPIHEICVIGNGITGHQAEVGNVCVQNFIGISADHLFRALKRIDLDPSKALPIEAVDHFHRRGVFNEWERGFLTSTARKRKLSPRQAEIRTKLNAKAIRTLKRR